MVSLRFSFLLLLGFICLNTIFISCNSKSGTSAKEVVLKDSFPAITLPSVTDHPTIQAMGLLKNVEDSGYPFFTITIDFPQKGFSNSYSLNVEEIKSVDLQTLINATGKYVAFAYTTKSENALLDLKLDGKSLLTEAESEEAGKSFNKITGILSQANVVTTGDLPGELKITDDHDRSEKFSFFITPEIVQANGKVVVGYYETRTQNSLTSLEIKQ